MAEPRPGMAGVPLVIGLVNGMPGEARRHTEQQFRAILAAAAADRTPVELRLFSLDPVTAAETAQDGYAAAATLAGAVPDGLIVTGMPPRAAALVDEPHWRTLADLVDVAREHAVPTVWSCLAAHAAVLYLDKIERRRLPQKLSALVECVRTDAEHPLMAGLPPQWLVPHSRYNDLPEEALRAHGYRILSRSASAGADVFVKHAGAPFLFCQGHPEYDAHALLREYRRDIRQFLAGARDGFPAMPQGYFGDRVSALLDAFAARAQRERRGAVFADFPMAACVADLRHAWRDLAVALYGNWLAQVAESKLLRGRGLDPPPRGILLHQGVDAHAR